MKNTNPINIANKITELSGIDVFTDSRERKVVEVRSLLTYLLRDKLKMRWKNIVLFYDRNGKKINMANVMHSYKKYDDYKNHNSTLNDLQKSFVFEPHSDHDEIDKISYLEKKCKRLEKKLQEQNNK
jgi:hypothetical protein|tara:strand:+ start:187 stop:567 length:381 start_codon:yes stop_codon:yes gene_type:complete